MRHGDNLNGNSFLPLLAQSFGVLPRVVEKGNEIWTNDPHIDTDQSKTRFYFNKRKLIQIFNT